MIIIEVRFGAINGNAITIDSALSGTSTNPVQNKVIKAALDALQNQINAIAATKEVVSVENAEALYDIENPSTEVVYITEDTGDLYIYDGSTFVLSTNDVVDGTIYVDDIGALIDMTLASNKSYPVVCVTAASGDDPATMDSYTLNVASDGRTLIAKDGFAVIVSGAWSWSKYSFEGHTHTTSDVDGLSDELAAKQDANNNTGLQTTDKSIVGAINEVFTMRKRDYAVNFYGQNDVAIEHNLTGRALTLAKIVSANVATLSYSILNGAQNVAITLVNGTWQAGGTPSAITIPDNAQVTWKATRVDDSEIAEINIKEA